MLNKNKKKIVNLFCYRTIKVPGSTSIKFSLLKFAKQSILLITDGIYFKYIIIPSLFKINIKDQIVSLIYINKRKFHIFYNMFFYFLNKAKINFKQITLRGSGFKVIYYSKIRTIDLKVGLTHKKYITLPIEDTFNILLQKPNIILLDYNAIRLGNFIQKIKFAKKPNIYSGRGFWNLKEIQKLKLIKKQ